MKMLKWAFTCSGSAICSICCSAGYTHMLWTSQRCIHVFFTALPKSWTCFPPVAFPADPKVSIECGVVKDIIHCLLFYCMNPQPSTPHNCSTSTIAPNDTNTKKWRVLLYGNSSKRMIQIRRVESSSIWQLFKTKIQIRRVESSSIWQLFKARKLLVNKILFKTIIKR